MPFNANTYYVNRYRKDRDIAMGRAREIKARIASGEAYEWEHDMLARHVGSARHHNTMLRLQKRLIAISRGEA